MGESLQLRVAGLFAGVGGIEQGLHLAGHVTEVLCEIDPGAQSVLRAHFEDVPLIDDIRDLNALPPVDLVAAGFPCQDLSQAGRAAGIRGRNSGLVDQVFRLLDRAAEEPRWLLLENVPFMLQLDRGRAMRFLTSELAKREFMWAYRVVDAQAFGLPQRRRRVLLLASRTADPRPVLFAEDAGQRESAVDPATVGCGFYWTEGLRGLGWAVDAVPTLKGGSTIGIPSPPAIKLPGDEGICTPDLRDAERLQGFPADWTSPAVAGQKQARNGVRWRLVGNAVSVPVANWIGERLSSVPTTAAFSDEPLARGATWPPAAWGHGNVIRAVPVSAWPVRRPSRHLLDFLEFSLAPLSERATAGFLDRTRASRLRFPPGFLDSVEAHLKRMRRQLSLAA